MTATSGFSAAASGVDASPLRNPAWEFLGGRLPVEDWTNAARRGQIEPVVRTGQGEAVREQMARALHRDSQGHLLITGEKGVGKTALVRELARRAAGGDVVSAAETGGRGVGDEEELSAGRSPYAFLSDRRFLWVDCRHVGPEDSRACFETILSVCDEQAEVVLCLDGLGPLLTRPQGGTNRPLLLAAASRPNVRIIGILGRREYHDLIGGDAEILDRFTRLDVEEPGEEETLAIARQAAARLQNEFALGIDDAVIERAVALCGTFLLSAARPAGVIRVLRRCCEEADYDRRVRHHPRSRLETDDVIAVLSELTGIPASTLSGEGGTADFEAALREAVVGQDPPTGRAARIGHRPQGGPIEAG